MPLPDFGWHVGPGAKVPRVLAGGRQLARDHPANGSHKFLSLFVRVARASVAAYEAVTDMAVQQSESDLVQRCSDCIDLGHDVDAVAIFLDHPCDASDLTLDPGETRQEFLFRCGVSACLRCHCCLLKIGFG
jgi:hypothetical protein